MKKRKDVQSQDIPSKEELRRRRVERFIHRDSTIPPDDDARLDNPLVKHMLTFANERKKVTLISVFLSCYLKWHLSIPECTKLAIGTMMVAAYRGVKGVTMPYYLPFFLFQEFDPADGIGKLTHPWDTGLFTKDTNIVDEERLKLLKEKYTFTDPTTDRLMITPARFEEFAKTRDQSVWNNESAFYKRVGEKGHIGEFDIMSRRVVHMATDPDTDEKIPCYDFEEIEQFYRDSKPIVDQIKNHSLPVLK